MKEFFLFVVEDRHADSDHELYPTYFKALMAAEKYLEPYKNDSFYEEHNYGGYEFYANYSCENDKVYIKKIRLKS